jgi:hypothetical protein
VYVEVTMSQDSEKDRQRTTIDEARQEGIGEPEDGAETVVPSYADTSERDVSDLGVEEPVVPEDLQGDDPDAPPAEDQPGT